MNNITGSIIVSFIIITSIIILYFSIPGSQESSENIEITIIPKEYTKTGKYIPTNWTGIPISYDNPMFIDPEDNLHTYKVAHSLLKKKILLMSFDDFDKNDELWEELVSKYENIIGWNGIIDVIDNVLEINATPASSHRMHATGELLMAHATSLKHAVEVSSRVFYHQKAALHGAVWKAIENVGVSDLNKFRKVANELCGFKYDTDAGNIWISCVHGIGHGLSNIFGFDGIPNSIDICASFKDPQFQFACATGVYMSLEPDTEMRSFYPCDRNKFPGACFRFKNRLFGSIFYNETYPCRTQSDDYHRVGCIWGHAFDTPNIFFTQYYQFCERYLPPKDAPIDGIEAIVHAACVDGILSARETAMISKRELQNMCKDLNNYPLSKRMCELRKDGRKYTKFTFTPNFEYYPVSILEKIREGDGKTTPAQWLLEWNQIPFKPPNHNRGK